MQDLIKAVGSFVVFGITVAVGLLVLTGFQNNITDTNSPAYQGIGKIIDAVNTFPDWAPLLALVIIAVVIMAYIKLINRQE